MSVRSAPTLSRKRSARSRSFGARREQLVQLDEPPLLRNHSKKSSRLSSSPLPRLRATRKPGQLREEAGRAEHAQGIFEEDARPRRPEDSPSKVFRGSRRLDERAAGQLERDRVHGEVAAQEVALGPALLLPDVDLAPAERDLQDAAGGAAPTATTRVPARAARRAANGAALPARRLGRGRRRRVRGTRRGRRRPRRARARADGRRRPRGRRPPAARAASRRAADGELHAGGLPVSRRRRASRRRTSRSIRPDRRTR